jgi:uncharacterized protein YdaU (DUF1376 family)
MLSVEHNALEMMVALAANIFKNRHKNIIGYRPQATGHRLQQKKTKASAQATGDRLQQKNQRQVHRPPTATPGQAGYSRRQQQNPKPFGPRIHANFSAFDSYLCCPL